MAVIKSGIIGNVAKIGLSHSHWIESFAHFHPRPH